jgi:hypothetical protein
MLKYIYLISKDTLSKYPIEIRTNEERERRKETERLVGSSMFQKINKKRAFVERKASRNKRKKQWRKGV